jgi:hypothetical protein
MNIWQVAIKLVVGGRRIPSYIQGYIYRHPGVIHFSPALQEGASLPGGPCVLQRAEAEKWLTLSELSSAGFDIST